jgi:hypothetical protein
VTVTRREFLARAATLAAATAAGPLLRATPALAAGTCTLGVWAHNVAKLQSELGITLRGIRHNQAMQTPIPADRELQWFDQGHWMIYRNANAETVGPGGGQVCLSWRAIANGAHDVYFRAAARNLLGDKRFTRTHPYLFSFHHEQIVNDRQQCGSRACGSPADYIAAYRHVRGVFDNLGATASHGGNVRFVWSPACSQFRVPDQAYGAPHVDPGPAYYDFVGVDSYNRLQGGSLMFKDPVDMLGAAHDYAKMRGKQLIIAEFGIEDGPTLNAHRAKAAFLLDTASAIASWGTAGAGSVYAWMFSSLGPDAIDSSPQALAAMKQVVALRFFG